MKRVLLIFFTFFVIVKIITNTSLAIEPEEILTNPKQELRAREISKKIRCLVCQNQSIDDSSSEIAQDLRIVIRKMITADKSNREIYHFLTERYGDFILLKPPFNTGTVILWILPLLFFIYGIFIIYSKNKK